MVKLKKCNFLDCLEATKKLLEIEYFDYLILRFLKEAYPNISCYVFLQ